MTRYLPILAWGRSYTREDLSSDLPAGVITVILLVPQGIPVAHVVIDGAIDTRFIAERFSE